MNKGKRLLAIIVILLLVLVFIYTRDYGKNVKPIYGVTFSQVAAQEFGLEGRETYSAILDEIKPDKVRLATYWNQIEGQVGKLDWSYLDWQIKEAEKRGIPVVLAIGRRVPRWPECHDPKWLPIPVSEQQEATLDWVEAIIQHYHDWDIIEAWQVENEPLLSLFGNCPAPDRKFLEKEIQLVKSLDNRPIIITDSGELSLWTRTAGLSDILGTTIYRSVWNKYLGYWHHLYPPAFYYYRAKLAKSKGAKDVIVSELQAEPWGAGSSLRNFDLDEVLKHFDAKDFKNNIKFARKAGFKEIYLWGAEWWYWLKLHGDDSFWQVAKNLRNN